jgi:hypothetical protein
MSDSPQDEIDEAKSEADEELGEMDDTADEMSDRLEEHESGDEDVEVPEPDQGESLDITEQEADEDSPVDAGGVPRDQGEVADEAGQ